jgi:hypothetical protein
MPFGMKSNSKRSVHSRKMSRKASRKGVVVMQKSKKQKKAKKFFARMQKSGLADRLEEGVPSIWNGIGAGVPGIWKGIRSIFNFKEAPQETLGSIPASYTTIMTNQSYDGPEQACSHPELGIKGIMFEGCQYLSQFRIPTTNADNTSFIIDPAQFPGYLLQTSATGAGVLASAGIPINPMNFGGRLAFRSVQFQRYRFNRFRIRLVSTCGVQTPGSYALGYYKDAARFIQDAFATAFRFGDVVDLAPCLVTPVNVAQSALSVEYQGPELYYINSLIGRPSGSRPLPRTDPAIAGTGSWGDAQNRQEIQGFAVAICDTIVPTDAGLAAMNVFLDYQIELYDPEPQFAAIPLSLDERILVKDALDYVRGGKSLGAKYTQGTRDIPERVDKLTKIFRSASIAAPQDEACQVNSDSWSLDDVPSSAHP